MKHLQKLIFLVVRQCNLSCKSCLAFSPLVEKNNYFFANLCDFEKQIKRISELFDSVNLDLNGGEPLLHPNVIEFTSIFRKYFPISSNSGIVIHTNGVYLHKMNNKFWELRKENDVKINISVYPNVIKSKLKEKTLDCLKKNVDIKNIKTFKRPSFNKMINLKGNSNPEEAMIKCREYFGHCYYLQDSKIHVCGMSKVVEAFNNKFNKNVPVSQGINIFDKDITADKILNYLNIPIETCKYCVAGELASSFEWQNKKNQSISDYIYEYDEKKE